MVLLVSSPCAQPKQHRPQASDRQLRARELVELRKMVEGDERPTRIPNPLRVTESKRICGDIGLNRTARNSRFLLRCVFRFVEQESQKVRGTARMGTLNSNLFLSCVKGPVLRMGGLLLVLVLLYFLLQKSQKLVPKKRDPWWPTCRVFCCCCFFGGGWDLSKGTFIHL